MLHECGPAVLLSCKLFDKSTIRPKRTTYAYHGRNTKGRARGRHLLRFVCTTRYDGICDGQALRLTCSIKVYARLCCASMSSGCGCIAI